MNTLTQFIFNLYCVFTAGVSKMKYDTPPHTHTKNGPWHAGYISLVK